MESEPDMAAPRRRWTALALGLSLGAALLFAAAFFAWRSAARSAEALLRAHEGRTQVANALRTLVDAETGQRGWLVTSDERFLEPYRHARRAWPAERKALMSAGAQLGLMPAELEIVAQRGDERLARLEATMVERRAGLTGAELTADMLVGKQAMDATRAALASLDDTFERMAIEFEGRAQAAAQLMVLSLTTGAFALIFLAAWSAARRRAAADRERLIDRFRVLTLATSQLVWTTDADGKTSEDSPTWRAFTGQTLASWLEHGGRPSIHPEDWQRTYPQWAEARDRKEPYETEVRVRRADGVWVWIHVRTAPLVERDGTIVEWIASGTDVTARKAEDDERARLTAQLRALLSSASVGLALFDRDMRYVNVNETLARINGLSVAEHLGRSVDEVLPPDVAERVRKIVAPVFERGERVTREERLTLPDGTLAAFEVTLSPVAGRNGQVVGAAVSLVDVTARVRTDDAREEASRAKDEFMAMLGHELRNPMAPIATALQLIKLKGELGASRELEVIERQVGYMLRLIDDLLDISRITQRKVELRKERLTIASVVAKAVEMVTPLYEQQRHWLEVDVPPDLWVDGDGMRLAQVISNLLTNAGKYTRPGGRIRVEGRREQDEVVLRVRDNGIGMSSEVLRHVFDPFAQGPRARGVYSDRAQGGLGLGLALVRSLVELHGGQVTARSEGAERGSELEVRLPAAAAPAVHAQSTAPRAESIPAGQPHRILVVDDNKDAAELMGELLRSAGHDVRLAYDGPSAMRVSRDFQADTAILDIGLPVMDGYELASRLRELSPSPPRMIAVTGYGQDRDRERSAEAGFARHLVKPVDPATLLAAVETPA